MRSSWRGASDTGVTHRSTQPHSHREVGTKAAGVVRSRGREYVPLKLQVKA